MRILILTIVMSACAIEMVPPCDDAHVDQDAGPPLPQRIPAHAFCLPGENEDGAPTDGEFQCPNVVCLDPYSGIRLIDYNGNPAEPRCGDGETLGCWGVPSRGAPAERMYPGTLYTFCGE